MPNPLRKLPTKPGRTAPSSRVKKKKKSGQAGFIGPRKFKDELAEDRTARHQERLLDPREEFLNPRAMSRHELGYDGFPYRKGLVKKLNDGISHLRFINDEVPIEHNVGRGIKKFEGQRRRRRGRFPGGVNEEPYVNPREGLQSERLQRLITLLEKKLLSRSNRKIGVNDENFPDEQYYSGTGESMNDLSYERYLNRG
jgi:hypothetical protein